MLNLSLSALFLILSLVTANDQPSEVDITLNGSISGKVTIPAVTKQQRVFRGRAYRNRQNSASTSELSAEDQVKQNYVNTIISLHPKDFKAELKPITPNPRIIQSDATFIPAVTAVTVGSKVEFVNDDPFFHNVFSLTKGARFNIGRRPKGDVYPVEIPATEWKVEGIGQISLFCDIHSQMNAVIISLDTPYFTRVNEDGSYDLQDIPAGEYELRMYNPKFDVISQSIEITDNSQELDLSFQP